MPRSASSNSDELGSGGDVYYLFLQLRRLSDENQMLAARISSQTEHISSLERQLQRTPGESGKDATIAELMEEVQKLRIKSEEGVETNERLTVQVREFVDTVYVAFTNKKI